MLQKLKQFLSYEASHLWFVKLEITVDNKDAVVEWLEDRLRFHIWLTSLTTGSIVFLAALAQELSIQVNEIQGLMTLSAFGLLFFSIITNLICIWSIPTWKFKVKTGQLTQGTQMRIELGLSAWMSVLLFLIGLFAAMIVFLIP
jgi:hypothetical protein